MRRPCALLLVLAPLLAGCTTEKKEEGPRRPVRFAVVAAPEVGANDDDLAAAIAKLSREPELDFVLVPGPLLAKDADATALELLKNDLGQLAPPVYVGFAAVASGTSALKAEEILSALEKMGPGEEHAVAYYRTPPRQPDVVVNVLGPDGKDKLEKAGEGKRVIALGGAKGAFLVVQVGWDRTFYGSGERIARDGHEHITSTSPFGPALFVPPLSASKQFALATIYPGRLEVQPVALEGPNPPSLDAALPPRKD